MRGDDNRAPARVLWRGITLQRERPWVVWVLSAAVFAVVVCGCSGSDGDDGAVPDPREPNRAMVEELLPALDEQLRDHAEAAATGRALNSRLEQEASREWVERLDGGIKYADLFEQDYRGHAYHMLFARPDGLNERGEAVVEVLGDVDRHALDREDYHVERIAELVEEIDEATDSGVHWQKVDPSGAEVQELVDWMRERDLDPARTKTRHQLLDALVGERPGRDREAPPESPLPRVTERIAESITQFEQTAEAAAELELRVADGALRYARDIKHFNLARKDWRQLRDAGGSKAIIYERLEETLDELRDQTTPEESALILEDLAPPHPQYDRLVEARQRYLRIEQEGGWPRVQPTDVEIGARSPHVETLRERLAAEGFWREHEAFEEDFEPDVVDQTLIDGIIEYQETHQFRADGRPTPGVWRSLNLPVEKRIEQIELSMERWRESRYRGENDFVMVNIPDFHAAVYRDRQRQMRFRVVTGNNKRECDEEKEEWKHPNATPIMMAELDHVIFNPYWFVPRRIIDEEIEPEFEEDEDYLEDNDYEVVEMNGRETVRQKPGKENALGQVKFAFPNSDNIYMHDTPKKELFDFPVRSFSHGCIRVHQPLELAEYLLANHVDEEHDVEELLEPKEDRKGEDKLVQRYVELDDKMPVFLEYYTVRVDGEGRVHFLADIYDYDKVALSDEPDEVLECDPEEEKKKKEAREEREEEKEKRQEEEDEESEKEGDEDRAQGDESDGEDDERGGDSEDVEDAEDEAREEQAPDDLLDDLGP